MRSGIVTLVDASPTPPRYPICLELFGQGSLVMVCSAACTDALEDDWYPGVRFTYMARPTLRTGTCAACIVCGRTAVMPKDCLLHDGGCPEQQWILTLSGMATATLAYELFGRTIGERMLITVEFQVRRRPGTDPLAMLRRLKPKDQ